MVLKTFYGLILALSFHSLLAAPTVTTPAMPQIEFKEQCSAAKEYVTTLNFLRDHKEFSIKNQDALKVASEVSKGCSGASLRFIQVVNLLVKAGIDSGTAIITGKEFAFQTTEKTNSFISIFKGSFLKKYLDMDLLSSKKIALELTIGLKKSPEIVGSDFASIADFCATSQGLDLPKTQCAQYALNVIKAADQFEGPIAPPFLDLYHFLTDDRHGPKATTYDALKLAESVLKFGPMAKDNFITAYRYALSKKGLDISRNEAIEFAKQIASQSIPLEKK